MSDQRYHLSESGDGVYESPKDSGGIRPVPSFAVVGEDVFVHELAKIVNAHTIRLGDHVRIDDFVLLISGSTTVIGSYTHIGAHSSISGGGEFQLGDFAGLSFGVRVFTGNEDFSGKSFTNSMIPSPYRSPMRSHVRVGKFAVVGANSVVLPGVTIGEGAVVGANCVVTRDCRPWTVYLGNPIRPIRSRPSKWLIDREGEVRGINAKGDSTQ